MLDLLVAIVLFVVGLVNLLPLAGVLSSRALAEAYGIDEPSGDLALLLRHRAVLFGIVGGILLTSVFVPPLQLTAIVVGYISMASFVLLAVMEKSIGQKLVRVKNIDIAAIVLLSVVPVIELLSL